VRARVGGASQALAAPAEEFEPALALPGWFAGEPPAEFVALLEEIAAAVRSNSLRTQLFAMGEADQRDLLSRIAVPSLLIWSELDARSPLSVARQFEQANPSHEARRDPRCRSRPQPRAARAVQRGRARVLSCPPPALALKPAPPSLGGARLKSPCQRARGPLDRRLRSDPAARLT
jgi:hypothetical protein